MKGESSLPRYLGDDLMLRAVENDAEAEKVIAINADIHGLQEGLVLRHWLFEGHPTLFRGGWLFIEDQKIDQAVATLSLMPTTWRYGAQLLPVTELGFVATRPEYRRRGLQRILSDAFDQMALSLGYTSASIEGIPGFYGQFGYEYAVPLGGGYDLEFDQVPDDPALTGYTTRPATLADVPALQVLYDKSIAGLDLAAQRDAALWTHQLAVPEEITFYGTTTVIEQDGRLGAYLRWNDDDWSDRFRILELAVDDLPRAQEWVLVALRYTREKARSGGKRGLRLQLPVDHPAAVFAHYLGAMDRGHYGWQMKVLDPFGLMRAIGPALEARLEESLLAGHSGLLVFDLYRSRLALHFDEGKLVDVSVSGSEVQADARMTLQQATQLWLGWRGPKALEEWYPDFRLREGTRHLLDVLFPKACAHIYTPY